MRARLQWTALTALCLSALLYLPVVVGTGLALVVGNRFVRPQSRREFFAQLPTFVADVARDFTRGWPAWLAVVVGAALLVELSRRTGRRYRVPALVAITGWSVLLLIVNGRIPYVRVWMFLLPFVLAAAAAGVERTICLTLARRPERVRAAAALFTLAALAAAGAGRLLGTDAVARASDTGTLRDGDAVAAMLGDSARARDRAIAFAPVDLPLAYHLARRSGGTGLLQATPDSAQRLWIVVSDIDHQREDSLVAAAEIVTAYFGAPRLVRHFGEASVYVRARIRPGCVLDPAPCR